MNISKFNFSIANSMLFRLQKHSAEISNFKKIITQNQNKEDFNKIIDIIKFGIDNKHLANNIVKILMGEQVKIVLENYNLNAFIDKYKNTKDDFIMHMKNFCKKLFKTGKTVNDNQEKAFQKLSLFLDVLDVKENDSEERFFLKKDHNFTRDYSQIKYKNVVISIKDKPIISINEDSEEQRFTGQAIFNKNTKAYEKASGIVTLSSGAVFEGKFKNEKPYDGKLSYFLGKSKYVYSGKVDDKCNPINDNSTIIQNKRLSYSFFKKAFLRMFTPFRMECMSQLLTPIIFLLAATAIGSLFSPFLLLIPIYLLCATVSTFFVKNKTVVNKVDVEWKDAKPHKITLHPIFKSKICFELVDNCRFKVIDPQLYRMPYLNAPLQKIITDDIFLNDEYYYEMKLPDGLLMSIKRGEYANFTVEYQNYDELNIIKFLGGEWEGSNFEERLLRGKLSYINGDVFEGDLSINRILKKGIMKYKNGLEFKGSFHFNLPYDGDYIINNNGITTIKKIKKGEFICGGAIINNEYFSKEHLGRLCKKIEDIIQKQIKNMQKEGKIESEILIENYKFQFISDYVSYDNISEFKNDICIIKEGDIYKIQSRDSYNEWFKKNTILPLSRTRAIRKLNYWFKEDFGNIALEIGIR